MKSVHCVYENQANLIWSHICLHCSWLSWHPFHRCQIQWKSILAEMQIFPPLLEQYTTIQNQLLTTQKKALTFRCCVFDLSLMNRSNNGADQRDRWLKFVGDHSLVTWLLSIVSDWPLLSLISHPNIRVRNQNNKHFESSQKLLKSSSKWKI